MVLTVWLPCEESLARTSALRAPALPRTSAAAPRPKIRGAPWIPRERDRGLGPHAMALRHRRKGSLASAHEPQLTRLGSRASAHIQLQHQARTPDEDFVPVLQIVLPLDTHEHAGAR